MNVKIKYQPNVRKNKAKKPERSSRVNAFPIVGVGASAGGLEAFSEFIKSLPPRINAAIIFMQHLTPEHKSGLQEILSRTTKIPVSEIVNGAKVRANHIYVMPPGVLVSLEENVLNLTSVKKSKERYHPIDHFLCSLAQYKEGRAIGVILSGTATDGTLGLKAIKEMGGITFVQDESAKYDGMPQSAILAGCVDRVLRPSKIAKEITSICLNPYAGYFNMEASEEDFGKELTSFQKILAMLKNVKGVDFTYYKHATIKRRMTKCMLLVKMDTLLKYKKYLSENSEELENLYQNLLIDVTSFFRDPEVFNLLKKKIFPAILKNKSSKLEKEPIRLWSVGCSTGEEAYSLVMTLLEVMNYNKKKYSIQIFATDINEKAIAKARKGFYSEDSTANISAERLSRFFIKVENGYQVNKQIRQMCVFAQHDITKDPPISKIDLICCRNLLIYFGPVLQKKVLPRLHYSLESGGYLLLGPSETIGAFENLFSVADKKCKIYSRKNVTSNLIFEPRGVVPERPAPKIKTNLVDFTNNADGQTDVLKHEVDRMVLTAYAPPGVVIDDQMNIIQFRGDTGHYFSPSPGKATLNILNMAHEELTIELQALIGLARKNKTKVQKENIKFKFNGGFKSINIKISPLRLPASKEYYFLVLFEESTISNTKKEETKYQKIKEPTTNKVVTKLRQEIDSTKEYLRSVIESQEATTEELKSANEEVQSSNEELQSMNEELETSKEELQSSNEELQTLNEELQNRNDQLGELNADLVNVMDATQIPIILVGRNLQIRRFTPNVKDIMNVVATDIGRSISNIKLKIDELDIKKISDDVFSTLQLVEKEVKNDKGRWYRLQARPYKTADHKIAGVVFSFVDIDILKKSKEEIERAKNYVESVFNTAREAFLILNEDLRVVTANHFFYEAFHVSKKETINNLIYDLGNRQWDIPKLRELLEEILPKKSEFSNYEVKHYFDHVGQKTMLLSGRKMSPITGVSNLILLAISDVTEAANLRTIKEDFISMVSHELRTPLTAMSSSLEILESKITGPLNAKQFELVEINLRNIIRLNRLIDDLLNIEQLEKGKVILRRKKIDFRELINHIYDTMSAEASRRGLSLKVDVPQKSVFISVDSDRITEVLVNIINNALKFTEKGSIKITLEDYKREIICSISDTGRGLSRDDLQLIFTKFSQFGRKAVGKAQGTGLGLAITKEIIGLHGGSIKCESELNKGTTFTFTLPKAI